MKKLAILYYLFILFLSSQFRIFPQPGWEALISGTGFPKENIFFVNSLIGFAGNQGDIFQRLGSTTDGGYTWDIYPDLFVSAIHFTNESFGYLASGTVILRTTDLGVNWDTLNSIPGLAINSIYFSDDLNGHLCGGTSGGSGSIARTTDGGYNWNVTIVNGIMNSIHFPTSNTGYAIGSDQFSQYLYKTTDSGVTWFSLNLPPGIGSLRKVHFATSNIGYLVSGNTNPISGFILKTTNGGLNWVIQFSIQDILLRSLFTIDENIVYAIGSSGTILKTTNGGNNWNLQNAPSNDEFRTIHFINEHTGYIGGGKQVGINYSQIIIKTTTGGEPIPVELISYSAITLGNSIRILWSTASELNNFGFELFRNGNLISFIEGMGTTTEQQNYSYIDKGLRSGIYNYRLEQIDFDGSRYFSGEATVQISLPDKFTLEQNYPNPFNSETSISFSIPRPEEISLFIYNPLGELITTFANGTYPAGTHVVRWDAGNLPSGIYLCIISAGYEHKAIKLLLQK